MTQKVVTWRAWGTKYVPVCSNSSEKSRCVCGQQIGDYLREIRIMQGSARYPGHYEGQCLVGEDTVNSCFGPLPHWALAEVRGQVDLTYTSSPSQPRACQ